MFIKDITPFKGAMMCVEIEFDEAGNYDGVGNYDDSRVEKIYIHRDIIADSGLKRGSPITGDEADRLIYKNDRRRARERALYLVTGHDYSYCGLYEKLENNYPEEICEEVCNELAKRGIIDDGRYARKLCRHLFEGKKLGEWAVRREMRQKGLTDEIIEEAMDEFMEEDDCFARLERLVETKYERYLTDEKGFRKVRDALARKGYSYDDIKEVLEQYS
ncbi:MAG: RecX family transcriptional regulator [Ruminococcus sp.]|nr:RecX family transcriptional regulator [Ruminococcus sp.]